MYLYVTDALLLLNFQNILKNYGVKDFNEVIC